MRDVSRTSIDALIDRYDGLLFDAYGVLVHGEGPMPGARELVQRLRLRGKPFCLVTNDTSRLPESAAARYRAFGLDVTAAHIVSAGLLLETYFAEHGLVGARCAVLGPRDGVEYVARAGGEIVPPEAAFDALVICDETGFPFLQKMDAALTSLLRLIDAGRTVRLIVPNPDIIYPDGTDAFGFAAGSLALMFEAALARRYPARPDLAFVRLGKPAPHLFQRALDRIGSRNAIMIGDQLETDIAGANAAGIDSALVVTGVSLAGLAAVPARLRPTYWMPALLES